MEKNWYILLPALAAVLAAAALSLKAEADGAAVKVRVPPAAEHEIRAIETEIDRIEAAALVQAQQGGLDRRHRSFLLGKLLLYDKHLSVKENEACAFCHMPEAGFTGASSVLNQTTVAYPGSIRTRFSAREPQTHTYATFAPPLHYNRGSDDFVGGSFWNMRATGIRLGNPVAEQAQGPPLDPLEMGLIDSACFVYRISRRPYRDLAQQVWGVQAFVIQWPANVEQVCRTPGPAPASDPYPVHLEPVDRGISNSTFDQAAEAIAAFEASPEVNPFSSKFDAVMAGKAQFTPQEQAGYSLFRSSVSHCNECHRDGGPGEEPFFTDFTSSNLGVPANPALPYYHENTPDAYGLTPNPLGSKFVDLGVGGFLQSPDNPDNQWRQKARAFLGKFKVPTLRNVDKRPRPDFVKAYMHNGYLKSLKQVVHFYNTRDALPRCKANDPGEKVSCWPAPEYPATVNRKQLGNLHLSDAQEDQLVAFLKTLSDGFGEQGTSNDSTQSK